MIILGIDPGSTRAGFGVIKHENKRTSFVDGGIITVKSKDKNQRLVDLEKSFEDILNKHHPDIVGIENIYFVKNQKTALEVAQSRGVLLLSTKRRFIPTYEFTPREIKMGLTGYGTADKKAVTKMVQIILKIGDLKQPDDVYDAIAIALVTLYSLKNK